MYHLQAFAMGLDLDPGHEALREGLQRVSEDLSSAQLKQARCCDGSAGLKRAFGRTLVRDGLASSCKSFHLS